MKEEKMEEEERKTVTSKITFRPTPRDNKASYACEAEHPAISARPMRVAVILSVQCELRSSFNWCCPYGLQ